MMTKWTRNNNKKVMVIIITINVSRESPSLIVCGRLLLFYYHFSFLAFSFFFFFVFLNHVCAVYVSAFDSIRVSGNQMCRIAILKRRR